MQKNSDTGSVIYNNVRIFWWTIPVLAIVWIDGLLKQFALEKLPDEGSLVDPGLLSFAVHKNFGIAFDIPFKRWLIITITIIIGLVLAEIAYKNWKRHSDVAFGAIMIIIGALGNLYDRIVYEFTIDYIIILGRSAINLADILIVAGVVFLLLASRRHKHHHKIHPDEPRH